METALQLTNRTQTQVQTETDFQEPQAGPMLLTPAEAVKFWAEKILQLIDDDSNVPKELGMVFKIGKPILVKFIKKGLSNLTDEFATGLINGIHALSFKLELQTNILNENYYEPETANFENE